MEEERARGRGEIGMEREKERKREREKERKKRKKERKKERKKVGECVGGGPETACSFVVVGVQLMWGW